MSNFLTVKPIKTTTPFEYGLTMASFEELSKVKRNYEYSHELFSTLPQEIENLFDVKVGDAVKLMTDVHERWYKLFSFILYKWGYDLNQSSRLFQEFEMRDDIFNKDHNRYSGSQFPEFYRHFFNNLSHLSLQTSFDNLFITHWCFIRMHESLRNMVNSIIPNEDHNLYSCLVEYVTRYSPRFPIETLYHKISLNTYDNFSPMTDVESECIKEIIKDAQISGSTKHPIDHIEIRARLRIADLMKSGGLDVFSTEHNGIRFVYWYNSNITKL